MTEMQEKNINFISLGCRLNILESEKIKQMLVRAGVRNAVVVNTCAVTAESERQSRQAVRRIVRENPGTLLFVTGCGATRDPEGFAKIPGVTRVVANSDKMNIDAYICPPTGAPDGLPTPPTGGVISPDYSPHRGESETCNVSGGGQITSFQFLSKGLVQVQVGCNHSCAYCIVSKLRGRNVSFPYEQILADARALVDPPSPGGFGAASNGYGEIVLTGVDIAGYRHDGVALPELCDRLLADLPQMRRLRLSSLDPGVDLRPIIDIMRRDDRMLPHMHLSMQSGADKVLAAMGRRHNADMVRRLVGACCARPGAYAIRPYNNPITFSWDMIFGFPGETDKEFNETLDLIRELKPIHLHAFPFSPRPGTAAATMPNQVDRAESKRRVKIATDIARENKREFMESQLGRTVQVLVEDKNTGCDAHDIPVIISGDPIPNKSIIDVKLTGIADRKDLMFTGEI